MVPEGVQHFPGGGGGSNSLFPIETHITCDFPGGSGPPVPPLDPHLASKLFLETLDMVDTCYLKPSKLFLETLDMVDTCYLKTIEGYGSMVPNYHKIRE